MRSGEHRTACVRELDQAGSDAFAVGYDLHVTELPNVEVHPLHRRPTDEDVRRGLDQSLAFDHALAVVPVVARAEVSLVDRWAGLLDLQEEGIVRTSTFEHHQVDPHADTANADDLSGHVRYREPAEQMAPILGQRRAVGVEDGPLEVEFVLVVEHCPAGRIVDDATATCDHRRQLARCALVRTASGLLLDASRHTFTVFGVEELDQLVDVDPVVPDVELVRRGVAGDTTPVRPQPCGDRVVGGSSFLVVVPASTTRLVIKRLTSHSNGPGSVSSKSRRSNARFRSGVAQSPKFKTWASPHNCTRSPVCGEAARSLAMTAAAPRK